MPEKKAAKKTTKKSATRATGAAGKGWTPEERAAMKARAQELKAAANKEDGAKAVLAKIAEMPKPDRVMGARLHEIVTTTAPDLVPRTWYGMPAYTKDDKIVCFFQAASKFGARYATLGFNDPAHLDDGAMWPTAFAVNELTPAVEAKIRKLVKKAVS